MMSGFTNKAGIGPLNKAWNWQDACVSEEPQTRRTMGRRTGTAAHLLAAWLPFGLPLKRLAVWVNTFNAENDFIFHYENRI